MIFIRWIKSLLAQAYRSAIKPMLKGKAPHAALVLLLFAVSAINGAFLPDLVPTHWDSRGVIDRYGSKYALIFLLPTGALLVFAIGHFAERRFVAPNRKMREFLSFMQFFFLVLFSIVQINALLGAQNIFVAMGRLAAVPAALLFDYAGRAFRGAEHGSLFGLKTKWTLADPGVWDSANKLASILFRASAMTVLLAAFFPRLFIYLAPALAILPIAIPAAYSLAISRKGGGGGGGGDSGGAGNGGAGDSDGGAGNGGGSGGAGKSAGNGAGGGKSDGDGG